MSYEKENRIYYLGNCIRLIRKEMKIMADLIILFRFLEVIVCVWGFVYVFGYVTMAFERITAFHALTLYPKRLVSAILLLILLAICMALHIATAYNMIWKLQISLWTNMSQMLKMQITMDYMKHFVKVMHFS